VCENGEPTRCDTQDADATGARSPESAYLATIEIGEANTSVLVLDSIGACALTSIRSSMSSPHFWCLMPEAATRHYVTRSEHSIARAACPDRPSVAPARKIHDRLALAKQLDAPFIEIGQMMSASNGARRSRHCSRVYGQVTFRRYERNAWSASWRQTRDAVIATAGGIVADERNFAQLLDQTTAGVAQASPTEHIRRVMEQGDSVRWEHRDAMIDLGRSWMRARRRMAARMTKGIRRSRTLICARKSWWRLRKGC